MIKKLLILASLATFTPSIAHAGKKYVCTLNDSTRIIRINQFTTGDVACNVTYKKNQAPSAELWNARNELEYCQQRAEEFIAQQENWGWECASRKSL